MPICPRRTSPRKWVCWISPHQHRRLRSRPPHPKGQKKGNVPRGPHGAGRRSWNFLGKVAPRAGLGTASAERSEALRFPQDDLGRHDRAIREGVARHLGRLSQLVEAGRLRLRRLTGTMSAELVTGELRDRDGSTAGTEPSNRTGFSEIIRSAGVRGDGADFPKALAYW